MSRFGILGFCWKKFLNVLMRQATIWEIFPVRDEDLPKRTLGLAATFALRYNCVLYGNTNDIRDVL